MAIDLATGFNIGSKDAIDERQVLTLEQMKNLDESIYPDKYFAICKDNGKLYIYDASNDVSETSGKFRVLEGNVIGDSTVVDGARYYTLEEVDLSCHFLLAKINFGDKTSFSGKMTFMFNHASTFKIASISFTEKKEFFFNHKEGKDFSYVMHAYPTINPAASTAAQPVLFNDFNFRGILTENNEFYLFLRGILNTDNYIHNFYIEYIGDGTIEETFVFDDGSTNPYSTYGWSATKWYKEEGISDSDLIQPGCITLANSDDVVSNSIASKVYGSLRGLGCYDSSVALTVPMYKLYPSQALFCDVTEFSNYQTLFPYEEEADAESRVYILCIARETNYYLRWERKDGTKQAICYNNDRLGQPIVWNMIVGDGGSTEGASTYTSLTELGLTADATVQDVIDTLPIGDTALLRTDGFTNWSTLFNGIQYGYLKVEKTVNALSNIELQNVVEPNYRYFGAQSGGKFSKWIQTSSKVTAAFNSKTFKIDITKGKESWNGNMKFGYFVDNSYGEIIISSLGTTNVTWSCSESVRYVKSVTYTIDPDNKAHVTIGVELYDIVYGIHLLETAGDFATINSFTGDVFTGTSVALRRGVRGRNNGVGILCEVEDLGLTFPCTTVQIAQAMRTLANSATRTPASGVIGIFNCGGKASTITDAPADYGLLHIETYGYDRILIRFEGISGSSYVGSWIGQIKSSGGTFSGITWEEIYIETEAKKEENSYIPDMYDRNSNGDIPVVGFDRLASSMCLIQNTNLLNNGDAYDEDYVGGWVYTMANDILIKDKEMFNKIKVIVSIPGVLRIGIVNDKIFEANPRYSTCLVKWLVADFVAFTGLKEYDISDTILEEGQYVFIECRQGESSWYYNQGSTAVTQGKVTYPAGSCTTGLNVADKLDSTTNNVVFKSQSVTSKSAIFTFSSEMNVGNKLRTNFLARGYDNTARTDMSDVKSYNQSLFKGGLNVGLYRRTKYSDTRVCKCIENGMNASWIGDDSVTKIYATYGQEKLVGKSVYAIKLDVRTPGNLTIYHLKGKSLDTIQVVDKYTHYVRAKGLQTIHLPFDIKINSTDEYIGFGGLHYKSTSSNIVRHSCLWHYLAGDQVTSSCGWMNTIGEVGFYSIGVSMTSYPETFTSFETNGSYLNIELICRGEKRSPLEDKYISFTGDSITTFAGFCTKQADVPTGNTAGDNAVYYPASGRTVNNVDATWWGILARDNRMQILRNDAWSGSRVSSTTGSTDTKCLCGTERYKFLENSSQGTDITFPYGEPEIIVNMIGTNDLSGNVELGEGIINGLSSPTEDDYKKLYNAYSLMCQRFATYYNRHGGKVVHFILPRGTGLNTYANSNGDSIQKIALEFEKIAKSWGHYFIPLSYFTGFNMNQYKNLTCPTSNVLRDFRSSYFNGSDGLHPNVIGMETIADGVHRFLCSIM